MGVDLRLSDWTGGLTLLIERVVLMEGRSTERTDGDSVVLLQCRHEGRSPVVYTCMPSTACLVASSCADSTEGRPTRTGEPEGRPTGS